MKNLIYALPLLCLTTLHVLGDYQAVTDSLTDLNDVTAALQRHGFTHGKVLTFPGDNTHCEISCCKPDAPGAKSWENIVASLPHYVPVLSWLLHPSKWFTQPQYQVWFTYEGESRNETLKCVTICVALHRIGT